VVLVALVYLLEAVAVLVVQEVLVELRLVVVALVVLVYLLEAHQLHFPMQLMLT
jgi:hypothetical protein